MQLTVGVQITDYFNCWVSFLACPGLLILEFKSLIILIVGFRNFFCCLVWAVDLGVQITDEGRSLYYGSYCLAITSLSRYLEEAAFSISISLSVFIFLGFSILCQFIRN